MRSFQTVEQARLIRLLYSFQLYTPKPHLEIYRNTFIVSVHPFGILFLYIFKTQTQFSILNLSIYV